MASATLGSTRVGANDLVQMVKQGATVIDVRTTSEFRSGHIAGSINVPMDEIESRLEDIPVGKPVVMVCQSGRRSEMVRERLHGRIAHPVCLEGGISEWERAGQPVVRSVRTRMALDRQSLIGASVLILASFFLGSFVDPAWHYLALLPGLGLMAAGTTGFCLLGIILSTMPWNKVKG
jgi:rhodanese-related sulfurtransferase